MLVLKQRRGEVIVIGEAHIHVLRISDEWVELGIEADPGIPIRDEPPAACPEPRDLDSAEPALHSA